MALSIMMSSFGIFISGCSGTPATSSHVAGSPASAEDYTVQLGYNNCDHMTAAPVAYEAGIFKDLGIKVNITGNSQVHTAIAAGKMDVGYSGLGTGLTAHLKGVPLIIVAANHTGGSSYIIVSNNITEPKQLLGKPISIGVQADKRSYQWMDWTSKVGIPVDPAKYQTFTDMSGSNAYLALKTGRLLLISTCDPWGSMAEYEKTGHIVYTVEREGFCCGLFMRDSFPREHPKLASLMILAHTKAIEFIYQHPVKTARIFAGSYSVPLEVAFMTIWKKTVMEGRTLTWKINKPAIVSYINQYNKAGIPDFQNPEPVDNYLNPSLLDKCGADDFDTFIKTKIDPILPVGMSYEDWKKRVLEIDGN